MFDKDTQRRLEHVSEWLNKINPRMHKFEWLSPQDALYSGTTLATSNPKDKGIDLDIQAGDVYAMAIPIPVDDFNYAIDLHELGHIFGYRPKELSNFGASEIDAWKWAREQAPYWNDKMTEAIKMGLQSYINKPGVYHGVTHQDALEFYQWLKEKDESGKAL